MRRSSGTIGCVFGVVFAAWALMGAGCAGKAKEARPQVQPRPIAVEQPPHPRSDALVEDPPSDFQLLPFAGLVWEWLGNLTPTETTRIEEPARYLLKFGSDGWFNVQTDCGRGRGMYETQDERIALALVQATEAACPPDSHHDLFVTTLESAGSVRMVGEKLYLHMRDEAKTMVFWRRR